MNYPSHSMRMLSAMFGGPASPEEQAELEEMLRKEREETRILYEAATSDGECRVAVKEYDSKVTLWTDGGIVYPAANADDGKRLAEALVEGWERKDWLIERRLFPDAPPEDYLAGC